MTAPATFDSSSMDLILVLFLFTAGFMISGFERELNGFFRTFRGPLFRSVFLLDWKRVL
jgi:hypothetical protein